MLFRKTTEADIPQIMEIIHDAQEYLKKQGIDQWQNGYPNNSTFLEDIKKDQSYVFLDEKINTVIATCMISDAIDATYTYIEDGSWLQSGPYIVLHRVAVHPSFKGNNSIANCIEEAKSLYPKSRSIRMDTHKDNLSMQRALIKNGFTYCGIIYLCDGAKRLAYENLL